MFSRTWTGDSAGTTEVPLNPADPDPIALIPAISSSWNDIHFKLTGSGTLAVSNVQVRDNQHVDQGWDAPTSDGAGGWKMKAGAVGTPIPGKDDAELALTSSNGQGWSNCRFSRTWNGETLYPPKKTIPGPPVPLGIFYVKTGNSFPVTTKARIELENNDLEPTASLSFSVDTDQSIVDIGSSRAGSFNDAADTYTFDDPVDPSESITLWWEYDAFSSNPSEDTTVTLQITRAQ